MIRSSIAAFAALLLMAAAPAVAQVNNDVSDQVHGQYGELCEADPTWSVEAKQIVYMPDTPAQAILKVTNTIPGYSGAASDDYGVEAGGRTFVFERQADGSYAIYDEADPNTKFPRC